MGIWLKGMKEWPTSNLLPPFFSRTIETLVNLCRASQGPQHWAHKGSNVSLYLIRGLLNEWHCIFLISCIRQTRSESLFTLVVSHWKSAPLIGRFVFSIGRGVTHAFGCFLGQRRRWQRCSSMRWELTCRRGRKACDGSSATFSRLLTTVPRQLRSSR